jgi:hypothetical protein
MQAVLHCRCVAANAKTYVRHLLVQSMLTRTRASAISRLSRKRDRNIVAKSVFQAL